MVPTMMYKGNAAAATQVFPCSRCSTTLKHKMARASNKRPHCKPKSGFSVALWFFYHAIVYRIGRKDVVCVCGGGGVLSSDPSNE